MNSDRASHSTVANSPVNQSTGCDCRRPYDAKSECKGRRSIEEAPPKIAIRFLGQVPT